MSNIVYDWEVKLKVGGPDQFGATEPEVTDTEIVFHLDEGGEKRYQKGEVVSFKPIGFRPFMV